MSELEELKIFEIEGDFEKPLGIVRKILGKLREEDLYSKNLMYRGLIASERELENIREHGTDIMNTSKLIMLQDIELSTLAEDQRSEDYGSKVWALPQRRLTRCVEYYALRDGTFIKPEETPMVIAYKPENMINCSGNSDDGKTPLDLSVGDLMMEDFAIYKFKEPHTPRTEFVAGFIIHQKA